MRSPLTEVWILVWIMLWTQPRLSVEVYVVDDHIPLVDTDPFMDATTRSPENDRRADSESDRRTGSANIDMDNIEGPITTILQPERLQVHCVELRSKRYISDGFCTSPRPITEVVCAGSCIPESYHDWYYEHVKVWSNDKRKEWRCVNDNVRQKKVRLICDNNQVRTYRIKTVRSCKCKRFAHQHNESQRPQQNSQRQSSSRRNGRNKRNKKDNRQ
ncbi:uncharacterized protein [Diadema antillarum]|uniref:uncharacterized protein n=1 Tax=Diadema antillarum TaxID=105358 RepID=UPI003A8C7A9A